MKYLFSDVGKFPCPFCGGESKRNIDEPNVITMTIHGELMMCRKTVVKDHITNGKKNNSIHKPSVV
jgi:hypothetical protein